MGCQLWHYDPSGPASVDLAEWELGRSGDPENIYIVTKSESVGMKNWHFCQASVCCWCWTCRIAATCFQKKAQEVDGTSSKEAGTWLGPFFAAWGFLATSVYSGGTGWLLFEKNCQYSNGRPTPQNYQFVLEVCLSFFCDGIGHRRHPTSSHLRMLVLPQQPGKITVNGPEWLKIPPS